LKQMSAVSTTVWPLPASTAPGRGAALRRADHLERGGVVGIGGGHHGGSRRPGTVRRTCGPSWAHVPSSTVADEVQRAHGLATIPHG
jgi:hypothetical protein